MTRLCRNLFLVSLCAMLGACAANMPTASTPTAKASSGTPISQMGSDFLYLAAQDSIRQGQQALAIQFLDAFVKKNPLEQPPRLQLAELLLRANQVEQALEHIDAALQEESPDTVTTAEAAKPHMLRARALAMFGQSDAALELLATLLSNQPGLQDVRLIHVTLLAGLKRVDEAHQSIAAAIRYQESLELRKIQADLFIRQNRLNDAVKALKAMQKLEPESETAVLLLSQIALQQKNIGRAEQLLREHIEAYPDAWHVRNALGRMLAQSGRTLEAITIYRGLAHDTGGNVEALSALGLLYFQQKDYENAAAQFRRALENSDSDESRFYLAASLEALEKPEEASKLYLTINKESAAYLDAQMRLASLELTSNRISAAEKRIKAILVEARNSSDAYALLSSVYLLQKRYRQLLDETEPALKLPDVSGRLLFNRAVAFEHFKQHDGIEASLKQLLATDALNAEALNFLGYSYAQQGIKLDEAEALIKRALEQKPDDGYYLDSLAWVYFQRGDFAEAIAMQNSAIRQITDDPVMFEHLGDMQWKSGDETGARASWKRSIELKHEQPKLIRKKMLDGLPKQ